MGHCKHRYLIVSTFNTGGRRCKLAQFPFPSNMIFGGLYCLVKSRLDGQVKRERSPFTITTQATHGLGPQPLLRAKKQPYISKAIYRPYSLPVILIARFLIQKKSHEFSNSQRKTQKAFKSKNSRLKKHNPPYPTRHRENGTAEAGDRASHASLGAGNGPETGSERGRSCGEWGREVDKFGDWIGVSEPESE